ncbi:hypothetical protein [Sinomonas mesophila]|uniref:hypothetical protein n=1 Tax=Sinomonas mesophila TaxID=1531955 RepID=UPI0011158ABD|nr:hypothetical protein [Sinomonas mesophila]
MASLHMRQPATARADTLGGLCRSKGALHARGELAAGQTFDPSDPFPEGFVVGRAWEPEC